MLTAVRALVTAHTVALMVVPKEGLGFRPEDVTGVLLLVALVLLWWAGELAVPDRRLVTITTAYVTYFLFVFLVRDLPAGYYQASVFWFKELSYVAYGYLVWRGFSSDLQSFVRVASWLTLPNLIYGAYQLSTAPAGLYGASPFGRGNSPSSSGMVFLICSMVLLARWMLGGRARWLIPASLLSLTLVFASGSKIAVVGVISIYGYYFLLAAWHDPNRRTIARFSAVVAILAIAMSAAIRAGKNEWRRLGRYRGFFRPIQVVRNRGIWWKVRWIDGPTSAVIGAGYSPPHVVPGEPYGFGMAMDNQVLYYLITGGVLSVLLYLALMVRMYRLLPSWYPEGRLLRSTVVAFALMGVGAEVLQLSLHGNAFWLMVGLCSAFATARARSEAAA